MPKYVALSHSNHRNARWKRFQSYTFAANETFVPLVAADLAKTAMGLPVAFIERDERLVLVAVTSLTPGINLFVSIDGQWLGGYVPSILRGYPFRLVPVKERNESVLAFDEESGLIGEGAEFEEGETLFEEEGRPSKRVSETLEFLKQCEKNRALTERATAAIKETGIVEDWPISVSVDGEERRVGGLKRVSEKALNGLSDADFLKLRQSAAMPVIYAHLLSMQNIGNFDRIIRLRDQLAAARAQQSAKPAWQVAEDDELLF
ncbi:SapC family protein [Pararhizobium haloflavum]|uniref:SapC family protein n=1 Tax=Pararhizobium haloflavum TaxID=2037914 RepID=UPI000C179BD3|nr:SapC family protein [Pararhizobium haloflavum]